MDYDLKALDPTLPRTVAPKEEPLPAWAGGYDMQALDPTVKEQGQAPQGPKRSMSLKDALGGAVDNIGPDAINVATGMVRPFTDPVGTAKDVWSLATNKDTQHALVDLYANRYGSWDGFKQALHDHPAEVLQDIATVASLGGGAFGAASKVAGAAGLGRTASTLGSVGRAVSMANIIDPVGLAAEAGGGAAVNALGDLGRSMWTSAAKPSTAPGQARNRAAAIRGAMAENIPVSEAGKRKSEALREALAQQLNDALSPYTNPVIPKQSIVSDLQTQTAKTMLPELRGPSENAILGLMGNPNVPDMLNLPEANKLKQEYQRLARQSYESMHPTPASDAYESLARRLRQEIESVAPEVKGINSRLSGQMALEPILDRALARGDNLNPISLPAYIGGGAGAGVGAALGGGTGAGVGSVLGLLASQALSKPSTLSSLGINANRLAGLMDAPIYGYNWYGRPAINMGYDANSQ